MSAPGEQRRKRLLTIGGCNVLETGKRLAWLYDHTHIWNVSWPSLGSPAFPLIRQPDAAMFDRTRGFIEREVTKSHFPQIRDGDYDVILTTTQYSHYEFAVLGKACIPDFTSDVFLTEADLAGEQRPSIAEFAGPDVRVITWRDAEFRTRVVEGFSRAYRRLFEPAMARGAKLVVYNHILSETEITPDGFIPIDRPDIPGCLALNAQIVKEVDRPGLHWITTRQDLSHTSEDAPWGWWQFHPMAEQYVHLAAALARVMGDEVEVELWVRHTTALRRRSLGQRRDLAQARTDLEVSAWKERLAAARGTALEDELKAVRSSTSWRVTAPLRAVGRWARRRSDRPDS